MGIKMGASLDSLEQKSITAGVYEVVLVGFKPKKAKSGTSINLSPQLKIVNHPDFNGRPVFENLNTNAGFIMKDFSHAFGLPMEVDTDSKQAFIPGEFIPDPADPDDVSKMTYNGPLLGRTAKLEVVETVHNGKPQTKIKKYFCAVPGCQERHSDNLS